MSPRTKEQFEKIRMERKDLIRSSALKLFARKGYHTTSISMIASDAKISKGLLYNYYGSKEDLLRDIILSGLERIMGTIDPNHDGIMTGDEFIEMLELNKQMLIKERRFWILYFSILPQPSVLEIVRPEMMSIYQKLLKMFEDYFSREGFEDPKTEAIMLGSVLDGVFFHFIFNPSDYPLDKVINRITQLYSKRN